jgi:hypothetical protein
MQDTLAADTGIVYVGYADAVAWVSALPDHALEDFIVRMGDKPRREIGLQRHALGIVMDEYRDQTLSSRVVRTGDPTVYDRDPRALRIIDSVLAHMEQITGGYAFEQHPDETQAAVWTAMDIAKGCAAARSAEDLHAYLRALEEENDLEFDNPADYRVVGAFSDALKASGVEDRSDLALRYLGWKDGFVTEEAYAELVRTEGPMRRAVSRAAYDHWTRFGDACGRFDFDKARDCFSRYGHAKYYDVGRDPAAELASMAIHAAQAAKRAEGEKFIRREREQGFSVYGYWFAPDGTVHAMKGFQIHETWIRGTMDDGPGISDGRREALALGWVSMTMMDDKSTGANIAYGQDAPCEKALKAAARIVRRGGSFENVVIEAYDGWEPVSYEFHEDTRTGTRRLNEISADIASARKSGVTR